MNSLAAIHGKHNAAMKSFKEFINYPKALSDLVSIKHLKTVCLPIGFPYCAGQTLACALTANPNIIMCQKMKALQDWSNTIVTHGRFYATKKFFFTLLKGRGIRADAKEMLDHNKFYFIPNQWQGRVRQLSVIGECSPHINIKILSRQNYHVLKTFQEDIKVPLKFIFLMRNPYDIISSVIVRRYIRAKQKEIMGIVFNQFIKRCTLGEKLLDKVSPDQVFLWRLEDHIADPQQKLLELCSFLNVESTQCYLDDCSKIFYKKPNRSRYLIDWPDVYKAQIATAIEQYNFLSGYSWDS